MLSPESMILLQIAEYFCPLSGRHEPGEQPRCEGRRPSDAHASGSRISWSPLVIATHSDWAFRSTSNPVGCTVK